MFVHFQLMMVMLTSAGEMKMVEKIVGSKFIPYSFSVFFCLFVFFKLAKTNPDLLSVLTDCSDRLFCFHQDDLRSGELLNQTMKE